MDNRFHRDFAAVVLFFGVPYALAVLVQDVAAPWIRDSGAWPLACTTLGTVALGLGGLASLMYLPVNHAAQRADGLARALATARDDLGRVRGALTRDVSVPARRLVTATRWLQRESEDVPGEVTRRHLEELGAQAERIDEALRGLVGRRSEQTRHLHPVTAICAHTPRPGTDRASARPFLRRA